MILFGKKTLYDRDGKMNQKVGLTNSFEYTSMSSLHSGASILVIFNVDFIEETLC